MSTLKQNGSAVRINGISSPRIGENEHAEKYKCTIENFVFESGNNLWYRAQNGLGANIIVRKIFSINNEEMAKINNDIKMSIFSENKGISSILRIREKEMIGKDCYVLYENFNYNLESYLKQNINTLNFNNFMDISKDIIEALEMVRLHGIVLKNLSLSNMAYCMDNSNLRVKFFNLTEAQMITAGTEDAYSVDVQSIGEIFLSVATQYKNVDNILNGLKLKKKLDEKVNFIFEKIKDVKFIEFYKIKSFANLIVSLLNGTTISIKKQFFFWEEPEVEKMIKIVNNCVDKNGKVKDKDLIKALNSKLKFDDKNNTWNFKLDKEVQGSVQGKFTETGCELLRFFRNKVAHRYDLDEPINSFFEERGGVFKYFFDKFDDLYFTLSSLYEENRLYERPKKTIDLKKPPQVTKAKTNKNQPQPGKSKEKHHESPYQNRNSGMNIVTSHISKNDQYRNSATVQRRVDEISKRKSSNEKYN